MHQTEIKIFKHLKKAKRYPQKKQSFGKQRPNFKLVFAQKNILSSFDTNEELTYYARLLCIRQIY